MLGNELANTNAAVQAVLIGGPEVDAAVEAAVSRFGGCGGEAVEASLHAG